jgi:hypothetical protein
LKIHRVGWGKEESIGQGVDKGKERSVVEKRRRREDGRERIDRELGGREESRVEMGGGEGRRKERGRVRSHQTGVCGTQELH